MSFRRRGLIPLACLLLAAALASCGGGGSSSSNSSTATAPQPGASAAGATKAGSGTTATADGSKPAATATNAGGSPAAPAPAAANPPTLTRASARRAEVRAEAVQAARHRALAKKAGKAAPFLVPVGDNSIPTYGSEAPSSELAAASASLSAYLSAREVGEWGTACAQMAAAVQKQLALLAGGEKPEGCAAAYAKLASRIPASARANPLVGSLTALRVEADKAFALFYGPHEQQYMMPMVSEGGVWLVNQIEPIPWPIGAPASSP